MNIQNDTKIRASSKAEKREAKKQEIADSALSALSEYGYANTSLRDIAKRTNLSLGMLHYYFEDKEKLLIYCVERYKADFIVDINKRLEGRKDIDDAITKVASGLVMSLIQEANTHRLWYDMRAQAMFDPTFQPMVHRIENDLRMMFEPFAPGDSAKLDSIYAAMDGLFRLYLQRHLSGEVLSAGDMETGFKDTAKRFVQRGSG